MSKIDDQQLAWGGMKPVWELLAEIASHEDWLTDAAFPGAARQQLVVKAWSLLGVAALDLAPEAHRSARKVLYQVHQSLRPLLVDLFTGKTVRLNLAATLQDDARLVDTNAPDAESAFYPEVSFAHDDPASQLLGLLQTGAIVLFHAAPFPLGRCQHCDNFFFRGTDFRRRQCTRACTLQAADRRRRSEEREMARLVTGVAKDVFGARSRSKPKSLQKSAQDMPVAKTSRATKRTPKKRRKEK